MHDKNVHDFFFGLFNLAETPCIKLLGKYIVFFPHHLGANLLANFSIAFTYETVITIGVILAVPLCSGMYKSSKLLKVMKFIVNVICSGG